MDHEVSPEGDPGPVTAAPSLRPDVKATPRTEPSSQGEAASPHSCQSDAALSQTMPVSARHPHAIASCIGTIPGDRAALGSASKVADLDDPRSVDPYASIMRTRQARARAG